MDCMFGEQHQQPHQYKILLHNGWHVDGLVQERRSSNALAMELRLSCTNPSLYCVSQPWPIKLEISLDLDEILCKKLYIYIYIFILL